MRRILTCLRHWLVAEAANINLRCPTANVCFADDIAEQGGQLSPARSWALAVQLDWNGHRGVRKAGFGGTSLLVVRYVGDHAELMTSRQNAG
jgi:hypothetical protein